MSDCVQRIKVLLLEDDSGFAALVREWLEHRPTAYAVTHLAYTRDLVGLPALDEFDVVVADLMLPDSEALETVSRVRRAVHGAALVVLTAAADASGEWRRDALRLGAQELLDKRDTSADSLASHITLAIERQHAVNELAKQAVSDPLTGLANRTLIEELLGRAIARFDRDLSSLAVLFVDLDDFKAVNDRYGHEVGDFVLREAAARIRASVRGPDTIGRIGGDEFIVVCEGPDESTARVIASRIRATIASEPFSVGTHTVSIGASVGTAVAVTQPDHPADLVRAADADMYDAKRRQGAEAG